MRGGPDVSFGEVWNILASLVVRRRRLRQASGCRSFFLSPSILGNDNVLYHSPIGLASLQQMLGAGVLGTWFSCKLSEQIRKHLPTSHYQSGSMSDSATSHSSRLS